MKKLGVELTCHLLSAAMSCWTCALHSALSMSVLNLAVASVKSFAMSMSVDSPSFDGSCAAAHGAYALSHHAWRTSQNLPCLAAAHPACCPRITLCGCTPL